MFFGDYFIEQEQGDHDAEEGEQGLEDSPDKVQTLNLENFFLSSSLSL